MAQLGKESTCNVGDTGLILGLGRSPGEVIRFSLQYSWASLVAQMVKNPPTMQETWVRSLGWEDPLKIWKPTPVFLTREFHGHRSLAGASPWGCKESDTTERLLLHSLHSTKVLSVCFLGHTSPHSSVGHVHPLYICI